MICLHAGEQIRQVEDLILGAERFHDSSGSHYKINGPGLGQLHHLGLAAQQLAGVDLDAVFPAQLFIDVRCKRFQAQMVRVGLGLDMADADDLAVILLAAAAARQHQAAGHCRSAHQRQERSSLHGSNPPFSFGFPFLFAK